MADDNYGDNGSGSPSDEMGGLGTLPYSDTQFRLPEGLGGSIGDTLALPDFDERGDPVTSNRSNDRGADRGPGTTRQNPADATASDDPLAAYLAWEAKENGEAAPIPAEDAEQGGEGDDPALADGIADAGANDPNADAELNTRLDKNPRFREVINERNQLRQQNEQFVQQQRELSERLARIESERAQATTQQTIAEQIATYEQEQWAKYEHLDDALDIVTDLVAARREKLENQNATQIREQQDREHANQRFVSDFSNEVAKHPVLMQSVQVTDTNGQQITVQGGDVADLICTGLFSRGMPVNAELAVRASAQIIDAIAENRAKQIASERIEKFFKAQGGRGPAPATQSNAQPANQPARRPAPPVLNNRNGGPSASTPRPEETTRLTGKVFSGGVKPGTFDEL